MSGYRRWLKEVMGLARKLGWTVTLNGHVKFRSPEGKTVVCSYSPRCPQTHLVARDLRKAGLAL